MLYQGEHIYWENTESFLAKYSYIFSLSEMSLQRLMAAQIAWRKAITYNNVMLEN